MIDDRPELPCSSNRLGPVSNIQSQEDGLTTNIDSNLTKRSNL